jgi:hypothetical protein
MLFVVCGFDVMVAMFDMCVNVSEAIVLVFMFVVG